ncbi:MAG: hypothetical protein NTU61_05745, partial [Candidatus Altiarchaeota archaeon]|nr:hypothetical protein [Candidatus Altiarchaeota archaeon]
RVPIYIVASPEEHRIITTKPDELINMQHVNRPMGDDVKKEFDINKVVQRKSELTDEQLQALEKRGFEEVRSKTLQGESDLFLIKNETDETDEHFILHHLMFNEIHKYTDKVLLHHTRLPDITFETNAGRIVAVEVEADVGLKKSLDNMQEKLNVMKKYDDAFYVVTNPVLKTEYEKNFGNIITREEVLAKIASYF